MDFKHGSLFSGIGGFDLAAQWMGWRNVFHCEYNPFAQKVLKHYWPDATSFTDITKSDFTAFADQIDILTGGFPCQPFSAAGKRKGQADERYLWPAMLEVIRSVRPRWVVAENVYGLLNWNEGLVFDTVQTDLEKAGYHVQAYGLPACGINAPHRRNRVWFVAYCKSFGYEHPRNTWAGRDGFTHLYSNVQPDVSTDPASHGQHDQPTPPDYPGGSDYIEPGQRRERPAKGSGHERVTTDPGKAGLQGRKFNRTPDEKTQKPGQQSPGPITESNKIADWHDWPTQPPVCGRNDGLSDRLDGITFSKWRNESIKGYGNAIVPQVALQIFRAIEKYEALQV